MKKVKYAVYMETWKADDMNRITPVTSSGKDQHMIGFDLLDDWKVTQQSGEKTRLLFVWEDEEDYSLDRLREELGKHVPMDRDESEAIARFLSPPPSRKNSKAHE